jgi:hypothetical protein
VVGVGAPRDGGRRKERRGGGGARQSDHMVGMTLGGAIGGDSERLRRRRAGEQGRTVGRERWGAGVTDRWDRGELGPSGQRPWCERERERGRAAVGR